MITIILLVSQSFTCLNGKIILDCFLIKNYFSIMTYIMQLDQVDITFPTVVKEESIEVQELLCYYSLKYT